MSTSRLDLVLALDEGSRLRLDARDPISVAGSIITFEGARNTSRRMARVPSLLPKWRDASPADAERALEIIERCGIYTIIAVLEKTPANVQAFRDQTKAALVEDHSRLQVIAAAEGRNPTPYPTRPDPFFHLVGLASACRYLKDVVDHEIHRRRIERQAERRVRKVVVRMDVVVDRHDAPSTYQEAVEGAYGKFAERISGTIGSTGQDVRFELRQVRFEKEQMEPLLLLADYPSGIVAAHEILAYRLTNGRTRADIEQWYRRLIENPRVITRRVPLEECVRYLEAAVKESRLEFSAMGFHEPIPGSTGSE